MSGVVTSEQVNKILLTVRRLDPENGNVQLTILARAFVIAVRSCKVDPETAIEILQDLLDNDDMPMINLDDAVNRN